MSSPSTILNRFLGTFGADTFQGGLGIDRIDYRTSAASVLIDLNADVNGFQSASGGFAEGDVISGIEFVTGTNFADVLTGDFSANRLIGLDGDDTISGGAGNDRISGGTGADIMFGGDGVDWLNYGASDAGVTVNLVTDILGFQSASGGDAQGDTISGFERIIGSDFADVLIGNAEDNVLAGGAGGDTLTGGDGVDTIKYNASSQGVTVNLLADVNGLQAVSGGDADGDIVSGFENVRGSKFNDTLTGNAGDNAMNGAAGADIISGGDGADVITGGAGADTLSGGEGSDTLKYGAADEGVTVDLRADETGFQSASGGDAEGDVISGYEHVTGSDCDDDLRGNDQDNVLLGRAGADVISGGAGADVIWGGSGHDTIKGGLGDDVLLGGRQKDLIAGGLGADTLDGGIGFDTLDYSKSSEGVIVDLRSDELGNQFATGGDATDDVITNFERIFGSSHDDILVAGSDYNVLKGRGGADTFFLTDNAEEGRTHRIVDFNTDEDGLQLDLSRFGQAFESYVGGGEEEGEGGLGDEGFFGDEGGFGDEGEGGDEGDGDEGEIEGLFHLQSHEFAANTTGQAEDELQHIIYNTTTGMVSFDADGTGDAEAVEIVQLQAGLDLDHTLIKGFNAPNRGPIAQDISITLDANSLVDYMPLRVTDVDGISGHSYSFAAVGDDAYLGRIFHFSPKLLSFNTDGDFDYLRAGETATQTIEYTVTDSAGATDSALVHMTIMGTEDRPIAVNDTFTGVEDTTLTLTPLLNDIDPEGGATLKIIAVGTTPFGTATVAADGLSIEFVPNADFTGDFDLAYVIEDDTGLTGSGVMNITITNTNDAPMAENITGSVTAGDRVRLVPDFTDPDPLDATSITLNITGAVGSAVVNDDGEFVFTSINSFEFLDTIQYTATGWGHLGAGETAVDTFQATLTDLDGLSSTVDVSVTVTGVDDAIIARDDVFEVDEKTTTILTPLANDEDPDQNDTLRIVTVFNTGNNTVTISEDGQSLSFTPWPGVYGETTFSYYVASSGGTFEKAEITVNVIDVNNAPIAPDLVFYSDPTFYDEELEEVIYSYTNQALNITDEDLEDGEVIAFGDYVFTITPPANAQGFAQFSFIGSELFTAETGFSTIDQYSIQYSSGLLSGDALFEADRTEVYTYTVTDEAGTGLTSEEGTITIITQKLEVAPILRYNANRTFETEQREDDDALFSLSTDRFDFYDQNGDGFKLHAIRSLDESIGGLTLFVSLVDDPNVEGDEHVTFDPHPDFWGTLDFEVQMIDDTGLVTDWSEFELDIAPVAKPLTMSMEFLPGNVVTPNDATSTALQSTEMRMQLSAQQDNFFGLYLPVAYSDLDILDGNGVDVTASILGDDGFRDFSDVTQTEGYWANGILSDDYSIVLPEDLDGDYTFKVSVNHGTPESNITSVSQEVVTFTNSQTAFDGSMDFGNTPLWEGGPQSAGFDLGGTFTVGDSYSQRLFQFDTRIGGGGPGVTADMSIEASGEVSVTAILRPEFTVSGGGITGTLGFDASIKTQHNSATDALYFFTDALLDADASSFTATSPELGFDLSITDLGLAAEAFLRVGGYVDFHTGLNTVGVAPDVKFEVPAVNVDALDFVGLDKLSLINYDGATETLSLLKDLPGIGGLLTATGTSISKSFTSGDPLGNELAHITVTKPELSVEDQLLIDYQYRSSPFSPLEDGVLLRGESTADFINFELDLDGVASTILGKKNLLDLGIGFDASVVEFDAFLELLDFDIRADVKYQQTNDLYGGDLFGNVVFENGDAFDFKFGDGFYAGQKAALDQNGDGMVSYELTTYSTASVRTKAEALLELYDYISIFDAGVSLEFGGDVKDALDSVGIPTDISIGTNGPLWDNRGYFIDDSWTQHLATAFADVTTGEVEQGFFFV